MTPSFNVVLPGGDTLRLTLTYMCGNRWRLRNPHAQALDVTWDVFRTTARGALTLAPRPEGGAFSEMFFETPVAGTTRVFYQGRLVQTKAHGNRVCAPTAGRVTIPAPDTAPSLALYDSMPQVQFGVSNEEVVYGGLVDVSFNDNASVAARQAVLDSVGGIVVGGWRQTSYIIRLPLPWTEARLRQALGFLRGSAHVRAVTAVYRSLPFEPSWLRPDEGTSVWSNMSPTATGATGLVGALEFMQAPLAWGCASGSPNLSVALIDNNIRPAPDLPIAPEDAFVPPLPGTSDDHGTRVAHTVSAIGNNGLGMTGALWQSRLIAHDYLADPELPNTQAFGQFFKNSDAREREHLRRAGLVSAVVNYSRTPTTSDMSAEKVERYAKVMSDALASLQRSERHPLVVIAAGNNSLADARGAGAPAAVDAFKSLVLVVGGVGLDGRMDPKSNRGRAVELYAPSSVGTLGYESARPVLSGGTSFAAPLVAGTAGLVFSFDPRLVPGTLPATSEVKRLLLAGARRVAEGTDTIRVLDAYGALRAAAQRPGAPLCGNRLWGDGALVKTNRAGGDEVLFTAPGDVGDIIAHHGGKRLDITYQAVLDFEPYWARATYRWTPSGWVSGAPDGDPDWGSAAGNTAAGTARSRGANDHDGRVRYVAGAEAVGMNTDIVVTEERLDGTGARTVGRFQLGATLAQVDSVCIVLASRNTCASYMYGGAGLSQTVAVSPLGDAVYVAVTRSETRAALLPADTGTRCPVGTSNPLNPLMGKCFGYTITSLPPTAWLIRFSLRDASSARVLEEQSVGGIGLMSVSEDGAEILLGRYESGSTTTAQWIDGNWSFNSSTTSDVCRLDWRSAASLSSVYTRAVSSPANCFRFLEPSGFSALRTIAATR